MSVTHSENIIEVKDISFSYGEELVLKNINLTIHKGDYLGIIGPNGGGKTTLLKVILGLLKPKTGSVKINSKNIAYVPQKQVYDANFPVTVMEVVLMGRFGKKGLFRSINSTDKQKAKEALIQVNMWDLRNRLIGDLSGGQQQRVFIARALSSEPEIIFFDEPTVGVDTETRHQFFKLLKKLNEELSLTLVLITHDIDVVLHHGVSEVAFVDREVPFYGNPTDLLKTKYIDEHYKKEII